LRGGVAVAEETEGAEIVEVALAPAFDDGADVIGIPEGAASGDGFHAVEMQAGCAGGASGSLESVVGGDGVDVTDSADAAVAGEDLVAEVARVGAEAPLVDAVITAEGAATFGEDFEVAPATEGEVVGAERERGSSRVASRECAWDDHAGLRIGCGVWVWG
jgi:hypothetical protein